MTRRSPSAAELDLRALEARTQAIGRALFEAAAREHTHLSVLNRWTAQVLAWCLGEPALKARILQFIDVLPSLEDPREIARHVREYFPPRFRLPPALRLGTELARAGGPLTRGALALAIRRLVEQVARQFIAEHPPSGAARLIRDLARRGATCSLDVLGEHVLGEPEAERYAAQALALLREAIEVDAMLPGPASGASPRVNLSVKPSALTPRFDPTSPPESIDAAARRLGPILELVVAHRALLTLDMERFELRDLTLGLAKTLLEIPGLGERLSLGIVLQAYLRDTEEVLEGLLAWLAKAGRTLTVRLVKGAYWDSEVAGARQAHWPVPVYLEKAETDHAFERLTRRLLAASPQLTTAVASHSVRSIAHAMATTELLGLPKEALEFQLLYGMGEAIHAAIVSLGHPVRIYAPIGELLPGMAYLVRRILENTSNESFLRQELIAGRDADALLRPPGSVPSRAPVSAEGGAGWVGEPARDFSRAEARERFARALVEARTRFGRRYPLLLAEGMIEPSAVLTVRNPAAPHEVIGLVGEARVADVDHAVQAAEAAQPRWAARPAAERAACLRRAAEHLRARRDELAAVEVFEVGKTWREADADLVEAIDYLEYYSRSMVELERGRPLQELPGERNQYRYVPRGVAAVIAPWNFPVGILAGMASAALAAGSAVVLKPAEQSSVTGWLLTGLLREAGVPHDAVQCLPGVGETVGRALVRHPGVRTVLFTGSRTVGLAIVSACAEVPPGQRFVKRAVVEMGGKNALIVDADADLDAAVAGALRSAFGYGGQKCSAASRIIVHQRVYDRFLARFAAAADRLRVGDPADPATDIGPLIEESARERLLAAIARAGSVGTLAYRCPDERLPRSGYVVGPAIAVGIDPRDPLATEELFGPLVCVFRVASFAEALALANDTAYALTGGVYSRSPSHLELAAEAFDVGNLYLNRPITGAAVGRQPFGGHRLSGLGTKAGGPDYLLQLLIPRTICANTTRHGIPLE